MEIRSLACWDPSSLPCHLIRQVLPTFRRAGRAATMFLPASSRRCREARRFLLALLCLLVLPSAGSDAGVAPTESQGDGRRGLARGHEARLLLDRGSIRWAAGPGTARSETRTIWRGAMVLRGGGLKGSKKIPKVAPLRASFPCRSRPPGRTKDTSVETLPINAPLGRWGVRTRLRKFREL